eukprot:ANDGO_08139.mRNA.1 ABC transporter C family member 3
MFFSYITPLIWIGRRRPLEEPDLANLSKKDKPEDNSLKFQNAWARVSERYPAGKRSVARALYYAYGGPFIRSGLIKFLSDILTFVQPIAIRSIIAYSASGDSINPTAAFTWCAVLFIVLNIQACLTNTYFTRVLRSGMHARTGLVSAIYRKSLVLSNSSRQGKTIGEITTLMSLDTAKIEALAQFLHVTWSGSLQILIALSLLYIFVGPSMFAGFAMMMLLLPVQGRVSTVLARLRKEMMQFTDKRVKTINEVMQGIRVIKFFAWEASFLQKVSSIRNLEMIKVRAATLVRAANMALLMLSPTLVALVTFETYAALGNALTAEVVFPSLVLFNILRFPMMMLPNVVSTIADAHVAAVRIAAFLDSSELEAASEFATATTAAVAAPGLAVVIRDGEFCWNEKTRSTSPASSRRDEEQLLQSSQSSQYLIVDDEARENEPVPCELRNINLSVPRGALVMIVGPIASGKSSLLAAALGEMHRHSGHVEVHGSKAYVAQEAWIQNATVRENILMGEEWNQQKYENTLRVCALERDIGMFAAGDQTEIGERGINLSGGQKQRISLARAVFSEADVLFLDDCLSAVDAHVGRHIFEDCIVGALSGKTRCLVTHQLQYVSRADMVVVMNQGGIVESGTYAELTSKQGSLLSAMLASHTGFSASNDDITKNSPVESSAHRSHDAFSGEMATPRVHHKSEGKLTAVEDRMTGTVDRHVIRHYMVAGGGYCVWIVVGLLYLSLQSFRTAIDLWLSFWSTDSIDLTVHQYMMVYGLLALGAFVSEIVRGFTFSFAGVRAARTLHLEALSRVLRAKMSFVDATPVGRILNRFSKDVDAVDNVLVPSLQAFFNTFMILAAFIIVICVVLPFFAIILLPVVGVYYFLQRLYRCSSRELKRLDSISRTPLYTHFSETLGGTATIRAYGKQADFCAQNHERLTNNLRAAWALAIAQRWLVIRLEMLAAWIVSLVALFVIIFGENLNGGLVGLVLMYAQAMTAFLNLCIRLAAESEAQLNSVERLLHFAENVPVEPSGKNSLDHEEAAERQWPSSGSVEFDDVYMSYKDDQDPILKGVSLQVRGGEKIGIVGRTGAGKSSVIAALFRFCELQAGTISIDGIDISRVDLETLRTRAVCIIPQDPFLFSGTVRSNLDPFDQHTDDEIWMALERAHLKLVVSELPLKLCAPVMEYGANFSTGQRQLFCLARALLRSAQILVLDEATASVDGDTDALIQKTIRAEFSNCTILTIAHRLNTIVDYDRVIVMDGGRIVETGMPGILLNMNPPGVFASMVSQTGDSSAAHLRAIAMESMANSTSNPTASVVSAPAPNRARPPNKVAVPDFALSPNTETDRENNNGNGGNDHDDDDESKRLL